MNRVKIILLTSTISTQQVIEALQIGARGIVLKDSVAADLGESLRAVLSGQTDPASPAVTRLSDNVGTNATLRTTCITTILQAGTAFNALPQLATATVAILV